MIKYLLVLTAEGLFLAVSAQYLLDVVGVEDSFRNFMAVLTAFFVPYLAGYINSHLRRRWLEDSQSESISVGDSVTSKVAPMTFPMTVVDINWAIRAAAVKLYSGGIIVLPVDNLSKKEGL